MNTNPEPKLDPQLIHVAAQTLVAGAVETHHEWCADVTTDWSETIAGLLEWDDREGFSTDALYQINDYRSPFAEMSWAEVERYTRAAYAMLARFSLARCERMASGS